VVKPQREYLGMESNTAQLSKGDEIRKIYIAPLEQEDIPALSSPKKGVFLCPCDFSVVYLRKTLPK
jgi:hypothetical protein